MKEYYQILLAHERTRCFIPIVPQCDPQTKFTLNILPGHHGTASGNLADQQGQKKFGDKSTQHTQEITLVKLIEFLTCRGVTIKFSEDANTPFYELLQAIKPLNPKCFSQLYLELYTHIYNNIEAYRHYINTSYCLLGQDLYYSTTSSEHRLIHYQGHNYTALNQIASSIIGSFVNYEHIQLYLQKHFHLSEEQSLAETIVSLVEKICPEHTLPVNVEGEDFEEVVLTSSQIQIQEALDNEQACLLDIICTIIAKTKEEYLSQRYQDAQHRRATYAAVQQAFTTFSRHSEKPWVSALLIRLKKELQDTAATKYMGLTQRGDLLIKKLTTSPQEQLNTIVTSIPDEKPYKRQLQAFINENQDAAPEQVFYELRAKINTAYFLKDITLDDSDKQFLGSINPLLEDSYSITDLLQDVVTLHNELEIVHQSLNDFNELDPITDKETWQKHLTQLKIQLSSNLIDYIVKYSLFNESISALQNNNASYCQQLIHTIEDKRPPIIDEGSKTLPQATTAEQKTVENLFALTIHYLRDLGISSFPSSELNAIINPQTHSNIIKNQFFIAYQLQQILFDDSKNNKDQIDLFFQHLHKSRTDLTRSPYPTWQLALLAVAVVLTGFILGLGILTYYLLAGDKPSLYSRGQRFFKECERINRQPSLQIWPQHRSPVASTELTHRFVIG